MKAIVLVGGEGTRLRPLTYATPKPLLPIANVAFLERQLEWLASFGVDEVVLSLGYLPDAFFAHFPDECFGDVKLRFVVEHEPLGTAGGIRFAADGIEERMLVCNGDVLTALDVGALLEFHDARGAEATIALTRVEDPSAFGVVPTREDGEVIAFVEKPPRDQAPTSWINAGTYVLEPSVLQAIPPRLNVSIERETFPRMLERPGRLYAMRSDAYWIDIGTPRKLLEAHRDVVRGAVGLPPAPGAVEHGPGVWVQPGAVVAPDARLVGPVLVGPEVQVGSGARLHDAYLGAGARIGAGATVEHAVLLDESVVADGAVVADRAVHGGRVLPFE